MELRQEDALEIPKANICWGQILRYFCRHCRIVLCRKIIQIERHSTQVSKKISNGPKKGVDPICTRVHIVVTRELRDYCTKFETSSWKNDQTTCEKILTLGKLERLDFRPLPHWCTSSSKGGLIHNEIILLMKKLLFIRLLYLFKRCIEAYELHISHCRFAAWVKITKRCKYVFIWICSFLMK